MFDLRQLRYFVAVAEHEHVGRAAKALNVTQSPLSRQIIELEARLELTLFQRSKKRLKLTSAGREFLLEAKALLAQAERLAHKAEAMAEGRSGTITVGYVDGAVHAGILSKALTSTETTFQDINLKLRPMRSSDQFKCLSTNEIDVALTYSASLHDDQLSSHLLHSEELLLAAPSNLGWQKRCKANQLDNQKFVWLPSAEFPDARAQFLEECKRAGFKPDIALEATSPLAALDLVSAGLGFAIVQSSLARLSIEGVTFLKLPSGFKQRVEVFVTHRNFLAAHEEKFLQALCRRRPKSRSERR